MQSTDSTARMMGSRSAMNGLCGMGSRWAWVFGAVVLFAQTGTSAAEQKISEAEKMLFMKNHMKNVPASSSLRYRFIKTGSLEQGFEDDAVLTVSPAEAGKGRLFKINYLTGERNYKVPEIVEAEGNPIILSYLEREIREMKRLTGGSINYYQKRIRLTLVDEATVKPVTVKYKGKDIKASEIRVAPYVNDPARSRYEKFAAKYYVFILSDEIPGGVYQLRGILPDSPANQTASNQASSALLEETLTFAEAGK